MPSKTIGREIMWNLPHPAATILYALFGVVLFILAWGVWQRVEAYLGERSGATFSHGLCPDCITRMYPDV